MNDKENEKNELLAPIYSDRPLPIKQIVSRTTMKQFYFEALSELAVGESFDVALEKGETARDSWYVNNCITAYKTQYPHKSFTTRRMSNDVVGVWRTK